MALDAQLLLSISSLALSVYAVAGGLIITTENIQSAIAFRVIPVVLGISTAVLWAANQGWIGRAAGM